MRKYKSITILILCITVFSILSLFPIPVGATEEIPTQVVTEIEQPYILDKNHKVTLNITAENADYQTISNVGYSLYFLSDNLNAITSSIDDIDKSKLVKTDMPLTDDKGKTSITTDKQGIYLVSCTKVPENVISGKDFIITLPYSEEGKIWQYELNATPKLIINTQPDNIEATVSPDNIEATVSPDNIESSGEVVKTGDDVMAFITPMIFRISLIIIGIISLLKNKKEKEFKK